MDYLRDERDVAFVLFDQIKIQELAKFETYQGLAIDDYKACVAEALKFAKNELAPLNVSGDREGCRLEDGRVRTPSGFKAAYQKFAANGFIGIDVPTRHGGMGLPLSVAIAMYEAFIGANVAFSMYPGLARGAAHLIENFGSADLAERFVPQMYSGRWAGTMCLTEPHAGSAVGDLKSTARPLGDGSYAVKGSKIFISGGDQDLTENIVHLVLARVDGDPSGSKGISLFVVPKIRVHQNASLDTPNDVKTVAIEHKLGIQGSATCLLSFGDTDNCIGYLLGERAKGMSYMFQMMNEARLMTGMQGLAIAGTAYEHALQYAKERTQFGNTPIIRYPDVRRNLMLMKTSVEGMRALLYQVAFLIDRSRHEPSAEQRAYYSGLAGLLTPICKAYCSDQGFRLTEIAMQVYGGYGYCSDYPIEQYLRDAKIASIYEGTNGIQALDLVGRKLGANGGQALRDLYALIDGFCTEHRSDPGLGNEMNHLKEAVDSLGQMAMGFMQQGASGDTEYPLLGASPFLAAMGDTLLAYFLLEQAVIAAEKTATSPFYKAKIHTAQFFVRQVLPQVQARAQAILSLDRSALEIEL